MVVSFCAQLGEQIGKAFDCLASCGKAGTEIGAVGKQLGLLLAQADTHSNKLISMSVIADLLIGCIDAYLFNGLLVLLFGLAGLLAGFIGLTLNVCHVLGMIRLSVVQAVSLDGYADHQRNDGGNQVADH
jgi:hypothetical protein